MAEELIGPLFTEHGQQSREAAKRKRSHDQISVAESDIDQRVADGWEVVKKLQRNKVRVQKPVSIETLLENRLWLLFYLMGYPELGGGRDFKIRFTRKNDQAGDKQIDVFAKDQETVLVVECKASEKPRKPRAATSKSPTRGRVKIPHLTAAGRRDDYALVARLATRSAASFNRQLLPSNCMEGTQTVFA